MLPRNNSKDPDDALVPLFKHLALPNPAKTLAEGRPVYDDIEVVEIRRPGARDYSVHPATEFSHWAGDMYGGEQRRVTYAERFARQYQQFKAQSAQTKSGTPLDHLPFLTEARRAELRAQNIYTAEQLAATDGQELKNLGVGGRELKNKAIEYIDEAKANVPTMQMQAELEALRARSQLLEEDNALLKQRANVVEAQFEEMGDEQLRDFIKSHTGHAPTGNPPRKMLVRMAMDARPTKAA